MIKLLKTNTFLCLLFFHLILGVLIFILPVLSKVLTILILIIGTYIIVKNKNLNNEVLVVSAYVLGAEVLLRMSGGGFLNEFGKYVIILYMILGMVYSGISKFSFVYVAVIFLLLPGIFIGVYTLSFETNIRKAIAFNISGEVSLIATSIYCMNREVNSSQIKRIFQAMCLPICSILPYLFLYTPNLKEIMVATGSNFEASGGFGPNQMSTILGLGTFLFFAIFYLFSKSVLEKLLCVFLSMLCAYRGLLTLSRGGMIVGSIMIGILILLSFYYVSFAKKIKILIFLGIAFFCVTALWSYTSYQSNGMLDKRYANQDARGRMKESKMSGREDLIETELQMFMENPIFGVGVGRNKEYREEMTGIQAASHNEITRLLAEHGSLGIIILILYFAVPILTFIQNKQHIFFLCFFIFWLLTINHAAMRIAAPGFIYGLTLIRLNLQRDETDIHRQ